MEGSKKSNAQAYDELSKLQAKTGSQFIRKLNLSQGDKVLDMGCGTGSVTKYIADIVGPDGLVVGVDPDAARIKIAQEKYKEISNLQFHVGSSATGFPHDNEPYHDVHISTTAFHWVPDDEKKIYIKKAHQCLKCEGKLAILCGEKKTNVARNVFGTYLLTQDGYQKLFQDAGLFPNVMVKKYTYPARFKSFEGFKRWYNASTHTYFDELDQNDAWKYLTKEKDGGITCNLPHVTIIGSKE